MLYELITFPPQPTATTRPKQVAKVREVRASPQVHTLPGPLAQVHTGETKALHLTNPLTGDLSSPPPLSVPLPHGQANLKILRFQLSWTPVQGALCSHGHQETAQNPVTLILSGECVYMSLLISIWISVLSLKEINLYLLPWQNTYCN